MSLFAVLCRLPVFVITAKVTGMAAMDNAVPLTPELLDEVSPEAARRQKTKVLAVLALVNFVNYADRQILYPLFPLLRREFGLNHLQLGELASAFTVVLALGSLPLGMAADRYSRRLVISAGVMLWSAATFLSGLAGSFRSLLFSRALVGIGEAAYTPAGTAMISATFSKQVRARVQGVFDVGMFIGGATGIALGGILADWLGWRAAFFCVGVPGLLLGLAATRLPATPRIHQQEDRVSVWELLGNRTYALLLASGWFSAFAAYTYITWGPEFVQDYKGFTPREAGVVLGLVVVIAGALGVLSGATLSDRFSRRGTWGRAILVPIGFLIALPFTFLALHSASKTAFIVLFGIGTFFLTWYHGPVTATIHDLIPSRGHASAVGLYYLVVNLLSIAVAPLVVGKLADATSLMTAIHSALLAQFIGAVLFLIVVHRLRKQRLAMPAEIRGAK